MMKWTDKITEFLQLKKKQNSLRSIEIIDRNVDELISFAHNDYFALATDQTPLDDYYTKFHSQGIAGAGSSRLIYGNNHLYKILEKKIADYKNTEDALVFSNGFITPAGLIPYIVDKQDLIVADKYIHASFIFACLHSKAKFIRFQHNDYQDCHELLQKYRHKYNNCFIITETLFSMDGDYADWNNIENLAQKYDATVISDDAHGLGIMPYYSQNYQKYLNLDVEQHIKIGTLSKAVGACGGYIACSSQLKQFLMHKSAPLIYNTALPQVVLYHIIHSLDKIVENTKLLQQNKNNIITLLFSKIHQFYNEINLEKYQVPDIKSPIIVIKLDDIDKTKKIAELLRNKGFFVPAIAHPTVPITQPRLRISISIKQSNQNIKDLTHNINQCLNN